MNVAAAFYCAAGLLFWQMYAHHGISWKITYSLLGCVMLSAAFCIFSLY